MYRALKGEFSALTKIALAVEGYRWHETHFGGPWYTSAQTEYEEKAEARDRLDRAIKAWRALRSKV